jgi:hypothetical protein
MTHVFYQRLSLGEKPVSTNEHFEPVFNTEMTSLKLRALKFFWLFYKI